LRRILADTGPLVAYLSAADAFHEWAVETLGRVSPPLVTCEAVLAEAAYLLRPSGDRVLELVERGLVVVEAPLAREAKAVRALMRRYRGRRPMDLADACLVRMAEIDPEAVVLTIDREFRDVYRKHGRKVIPTIMP
jgi:predicted nucleic acid-binding protein